MIPICTSTRNAPRCTTKSTPARRRHSLRRCCATITYYIVGLVSYLAKGVHALGWPWSAESTATAAPLAPQTVERLKSP